jgi:hypothetical protein
MARSLIGGGTIKVPDAEIVDICDFFAHSLGDPTESTTMCATAACRTNRSL